jgi:hypothetical protein
MERWPWLPSRAMTITIKEIRSLPVKKRFEIVDQILETIPDQPMPASLKKEILRRDSEMAKNPKLGRNWTEIKRSAKKR